MRIISKAISVTLLCLIFLVSCGGVTPVSTVTPTLTAMALPNTTYTPTQTPTSLPTTTPTPILSLIPVPMLSSVTPASSSENYHLVVWTPEKAEALIRLMQNYPETLPYIERGYHDYSYLESFYYATWAEYEALLRFSNDPRSNRWKWWLGNDIAVSYQFTHDGQAGKYYAKLIFEGLNSGQTKIDNLSDWVLNNNPKSQVTLIRLKDAPVGYIHSYVLRFDSAYLWILESSSGFHVYPLVDDFYYASYEYKVQDLTEDNTPEFIVSFFRDTNFVTGISEIYVFDLSHAPFQKLSFNSNQSDSLGWIGYDWSISNIANIQIRDEYSLGCPIYRVEDYRWNGKWFELGGTHFEFDPSKANELKYCDQLSLGSTFLSAKPTELVSLFEALTPYWPILDTYLEPPNDAKDELRFRLGVLYALAGDQSKAVGYFTDIVDNPSVSSSSWITPSKKFLGAYTSPDQIYRACSTTLICDPKFAIEQLVLGLKTKDYHDAVKILKSLGVPILTNSLYEFNGDDSPELWFTVRHPHKPDIEFWTLSHSTDGLFAQYVNDVSVASPKINVFQNGSNYFTFQIDRNELYTFYLTMDEKLVFSKNSAAEEIPPDVLTRRTFEDIRYALYDGEDPIQVRDDLLALRKDPEFICSPVVDDNSYFSYRAWPYINYCQGYLYTLALAYELSGDNMKAVQIYWSLWRDFPESPYSLMAQYKLELSHP